VQVDIAGLAETNSPWQLYHIRNEFLTRMKKHYQISKTVFGTIDPSTDSVHITDKFQAGGNLTIVQGQWTTTVDSLEITDPTGLGRWSGFTLWKDQAITIITGYRSCKGNPTRAGLAPPFIASTNISKPTATKAPIHENYSCSTLQT
jgi:hypothetical protein